MSSDKQCCVPGCKDSGGMHRVLHGFPNPEKERECFNTWLYAIGGDILGLENEHIFKYRRICHAHFEEKYLCRNNRISKIAVPSLNMADPLSKTTYTSVTRKPMQQIENQRQPSMTIDLNQPMASTSTMVNIDKENMQNIEPEALVLEQVPPVILPVAEKNLLPKINKEILPPDSKDTADLLLFIDNIFDSVNGSFKKNKNAKPLLGPVTPKSIHHTTWIEGKKIFKTMKFINSIGREECVPTVTNWVWTLDGIEVLLKNLQLEFGVTSVWLRHLNQDPLENFFGAARSHGCRNVNPTCDQFEAAFATLLINNLNSVHTRGKNCEEDFCHALHALVITDNSETTSTSVTIDIEKILEINFTPLEDKEKDPRVIAPLQYVSGYFIKKAKTTIFKECGVCKVDLLTNDEIEYISYREYAGRRWLSTPSNDLIRLISNMQDIINLILKENFEIKDLKEIIKTAMAVTIDFNCIKCDTHKYKLIDYLTNIVIRRLVYNYCKNINKILAGRREIDDDEDVFQVKAKKLHSKCFKRKV